MKHECIEGRNYPLTMLIVWEFTLLRKNTFRQVGDTAIYGATLCMATTLYGIQTSMWKYRGNNR